MQRLFEDSVYEQYFLQGIQPDPTLKVSEWADQYRQLPQASSAAAGRWRNDRTPYLVEVMDCLSPDSEYSQVCFMAPAQIGKTELGINWILYNIHLNPGPTMVVQPNLDLTGKFSKQRINPSIEACDVVKDRVSESKSRDSSNTIFMKEFAGGVLVMVGANSPVGLRSMPIKYLWMDESSAYPQDAGGEGDPAGLAIKRTTTFPNSKILHTSTPLDKSTCRISRIYEQSDQRQYYVPCPDCGEFQTLKFANLRFERNEIYELTSEPIYECEICKAEIDEYFKTQMLAAGEWRTHKKQRNVNKIAGFWINGLYSPIGWLGWSDIVQEFLLAKKKEDPSLLKLWVNTVLAETWDDDSGVQADEEELYRRREMYDVVPSHAGFLVCGADVQKDRIEAEVIAYGESEESWSIEYRIFEGSPSSPQVWQDLDMFLQKKFKHESGSELPIMCTMIDSGGSHTKEVYQFVKPRENRRIYAIKGSSTPNSPIIKRPTKNNELRVKLFSVGTDTAKENIFYRMQIKEPGPGYMHFPTRYGIEYFRQLTAERLVIKYEKGKEKRFWKKIRKRNEALDIRVYCTAALALMRPDLKAFVKMANANMIK